MTGAAGAVPSGADAVVVSRSGFVTTITLNRPARRNAIDPATARALADVFRAFDADADARVAVLTGSGAHFCAGADLVAAAGGEAFQLDDAHGDGPLGPTRLVLDKPVVAAVAGFAVAGGLELALWCDLRVVEQTATFGVFCRRLGVPLVDGGTSRLPRLIGLSRALDLILTGRPVHADEALAIGLANRVVPAGAALAEATALAEQLAAFPQACLRADRRAALRAHDLPLREALVHEARSGQEVFRAEGKAGADRFADGAFRHGRFHDGDGDD